MYNLITSYHNTNNNTTYLIKYHILSNDKISHLTISHNILSCPILSYLILSYLILSYSCHLSGPNYPQFYSSSNTVQDCTVLFCTMLYYTIPSFLPQSSPIASSRTLQTFPSLPSYAPLPYPLLCNPLLPLFLPPFISPSTLLPTLLSHLPSFLPSNPPCLSHLPAVSLYPSLPPSLYLSEDTPFTFTVTYTVFAHCTVRTISTCSVHTYIYFLQLIDLLLYISDKIIQNNNSKVRYTCTSFLDWIAMIMWRNSFT